VAPMSEWRGGVIVGGSQQFASLVTSKEPHHQAGSSVVGRNGVRLQISQSAAARHVTPTA
jgi:hypothetical protein